VKYASKIPEKVRDYISVSVITAAILAFFSRFFFTGDVFFIGDIYTQFYPWKAFLKSCAENGATPFWTPFVFSGMPFAADVQKGAFYPPGIFFYLFDFPLALKFYLAVHFIFMGCSSYFLIRSLGFRSLPSLAGTFVLLFNTFSVTKINFLSALGSYSLMPAIVLSFRNFLSTKKSAYWAVFILLFAASFLSGHPPTLIYTAAFIFFFWIYDSWINRKFTLDPSRLLKAAAYLAAGFAGMILLTMPQSGLFFDFIRETSRIQMDYAEASANSMPFSGLLSFLMPGGPSGISYDPLTQWPQYSTGILNFFTATFVFLFILSFFYPKTPLYVFSLILISVSLLLSLGNNTPIHSWFYAFAPFFWSLRHPGFAMTLFVIPAAIITAFTVQSIRLLTPIQMSLFDNMSLFSRARNYFDVRFASKLFSVFLFLAAFCLLVFFNADRAMKVYGITASGFLLFTKGMVFFLCVFLLNTLLFFFYEKNAVSKNFYFTLILFFVFSEALFFISPLNPALPSSIYSGVPGGRETAGILRSSNYKFMHTRKSALDRSMRGATVLEAQLKYISTMPSNTGVLYGLYDAGGYNPLMLRQYSDFIAPIFNGDEILMPERLNLLNVKHLITTSDISAKGYEKVYDNGLRKIYKSQNTLPRFFVSKSKEYPDIMMAQSSWSRKNEFDFDSLKINVNTKSEGYFVYASNYYPGWKAYVNNMAVETERCFGIYTGVKIGPGSNEILLLYAPVRIKEYSTAFYAGFALSFLAGLLAVSGLRSRHAKQPWY